MPRKDIDGLDDGLNGDPSDEALRELANLDDDLDEDDDEFDDEDESDEDDDDDSDDESEDEEEPVIPLKYTMTNESISVVSSTGKTYNIQRNAPNFEALRRALTSGDWSAAEASLEVRSNVERWANGKFTFTPDGTGLLYQGQPVPESFSRRVLDMSARDQDPQALFNFYERLQRNPSYRSTQQLFQFLEHVHIPILKSGHFLAYKGVREDYKDVHSGTFDNRPGNRHEMPRNQISDDQNVACHVGFHVGALEYARNFGGESSRIVVCLVDPADVVCVPNDYSAQKVRVCRYAVIGHYGDPLPEEDFDKLLGVQVEAVVEPAKPEPTEVKSEGEPLISDEVIASVPTTVEGLMALPICELRRLAVQDLHIVGAGHILGGKVPVIARIMEVLLNHRKA